MTKEIRMEKEPKLYRLFLNSRKNNRVAGAYLLYGQRNAPLKETARYLSQSLSCERDVFACNECPSCLRFLNHTHPDFILIDGENKTIKKEDIHALEEKFSQTAFEKGHRLTYVIHCVENRTEEAANAILKFLEEPKSGQVAFLTSYNPDKVLKTILSRSLSIRVDPIDPKGFQTKLEEREFVSGKKKIHLSAGASYILSRLFSDEEEVRKRIEENGSFLTGYQAAEDFFTALPASFNKASYVLLLEISQRKDSACYNWLYLTINEIFSMVLLDEKDEDNPFNDIIRELSKKKENVRNGQKIISEALSLRQLNLNPTLVAAKLSLALKGKSK